MPQLGASEAHRAFRLADLLPSSWDVASRLRMVRALSREMPFSQGAPSSLVGGSGFLILPHDPCRAIGLVPHVRRLLHALEGQVALACTPEVLHWLPSLSAEEILVCQTTRDALDGWCRETADRRRGWAWSLDEQPTADTLASLAWLGGARRIASDIPEYAGVANIRLPNSGGDESLESRRLGFASRLGLELPPFERSVYSPGASVVLELPIGIKRGEIRHWVDYAAALSTQYPLIVVHFDFLLPEMGEALRGLGNRLSLMRVSRSDDVYRLGREVKAWVAQIGPAAILASQGGCAPVLLGRDPEPALDIGPESSRGVSFAKFLGRRNPTPSELVKIMLDLPAHGM